MDNEKEAQSSIKVTVQGFSPGSYRAKIEMWDSKSTPFKNEAWTEYGIGVAVILLRMGARLKIVRWNWHGDDFIIILVLLLWSVSSSKTDCFSLLSSSRPRLKQTTNCQVRESSRCWN